MELNASTLHRKSIRLQWPLENHCAKNKRRCCSTQWGRRRNSRVTGGSQQIPSVIGSERFVGDPANHRSSSSIIGQLMKLHLRRGCRLSRYSVWTKEERLSP